MGDSETKMVEATSFPRSGKRKNTIYSFELISL